MLTKGVIALNFFTLSGIIKKGETVFMLLSFKLESNYLFLTVLSKNSSKCSYLFWGGDGGWVIRDPGRASAQASLKLTITVQDAAEVMNILSLPPKFWDGRHGYYT